MNVEIKKGKLAMVVSTLGAEPQSLKLDGMEYLWQGDKEYWFRRAPLLFPMIGPTKDDKIWVKGREYSMPNNGFARDTEFELVASGSDWAEFRLEDSEKTRRENYPYGFSLTVRYTLLESGYNASATIMAKDDLYYTFAWHPAFSLDINGRGCSLESYSLSFEKNEHLDRLYQSGESYVREKDFLVGDTIELRRTETDKGPIVLRGVESREITLTSTEGEHGVTAELGNMTTFVAWTQQGRHGQFICLEPMVSFGFADRPLEIEKMEETRHLEKDHSEVWENTFRIF